MADSVVNLGQAGYQDFGNMSMDEMLFGAPAGLDTLRRTKPSYDETGEAYRFEGDNAVPFIDEEGYRVTLGADERSYYTRATEGMGERAERANPYAGQARPMFDIPIEEALDMRAHQGGLFPKSMEGTEGVYVPRRVTVTPEGKVVDQPVGFENGGIASVMPVNKPLLSDRDAAVGGKLLKLAGIQQGPNEVMSGLGPDLLDQVSRILGRKIG